MSFSTIEVSANYGISGEFISMNSNVVEPYDQFEGKVLLVEAFATWCEPCILEMYEYSRLKESFGDNLTMLSLSVSPGTDDAEKILKFKQRAQDTHNFQATWEFGLDFDEDFTFQYNITRIPTSLLFDENGTEVHRWVGETTAEEIGAFIDANVTFPEVNRNEIFIRQLLNNGFFRGFALAIVLALIYRFLVPKNEN